MRGRSGVFVFVAAAATARSPETVAVPSLPTSEELDELVRSRWVVEGEIAMEADRPRAPADVNMLREAIDAMQACHREQRDTDDTIASSPGMRPGHAEQRAACSVAKKLWGHCRGRLWRRGAPLQAPEVMETVLDNHRRSCARSVARRPWGPGRHAPAPRPRRSRVPPRLAPMKAAVLHGARDVRLEEVPDPRITGDQSPGEVELRRHLRHQSAHLPRRVSKPGDLPRHPGARLRGVVEEVGTDVTHLRPGDRVAVDPILPCHRCPACRSGHINACATLRLLGIELPGSGIRRRPARSIHPLPDAVSLAHVPMVEVTASRITSAARRGPARRDGGHPGRRQARAGRARCALPRHGRGNDIITDVSLAVSRRPASWAPSTRST